MFNNLIKTLLGGAGQGVQKIQQYLSPTPAPKTISQNQMMSQYSFPQAQPVNLAPAVQSGGLKINSVGSTPVNYTNSGSGGTSTGTGGSTSSYGGTVAPTIWRNSISSLIPKVYAADNSATPVGTDNSKTLNPLVGAFGPIAQLATAYSTGRQFLADKGIIGQQTGNYGQLIKNIMNPHAGSWNGATDFGATEFISPFDKGMGIGPAINKLATSFNPVTGGSSTTTDKSGTILDTLNSNRNNQIGDLTRSSNGFGSVGTGKASSASSFSDMSTALDAIDQNTQSKLDALYGQMANGQISEEEYRKQAAQAEADANSQVYDQLIANQQAEIPLINSEFNASKASLDAQVPQQQALADKAITNAKNTYGDVMRQTVLNKDASIGNLRNMFGSLGTADSSSFQDKATQLERAAGNNVAQSNTELAGKIADINAAMDKFKTDIQTQVNSLDLERQKQIKTVMDNVNMSQAQKKANIEQINAQMYKDLVGIKQYHDQQTNAFLALKQNVIANTGDLMKNAVISDSLYNRQQPVQTFDSGQTGGSSTILKAPVNQKGVRQFDPITGKYYYLDLTTGQKTYV